MSSMTSNLVDTEPDISGSAQDKIILVTTGYTSILSSFNLNLLILSKETDAEKLSEVLIYMYICVIYTYI